MDTSLERMGQKGKCVTLLGNQAKLEQSGSKSRRGCETRVQERKTGCSARGSSVWQPALRYGGGLASWKPGVTGDKQPPLFYCAYSQIILDFDHVKSSTLVCLFPDITQWEGGFLNLTMNQILLA